MSKIFNIYGVGKTVQEVHETFANEKRFQEALASGNNLAVRIFLNARGFNRVSREFAAEVLAA